MARVTAAPVVAANMARAAVRSAMAEAPEPGPMVPEVSAGAAAEQGEQAEPGGLAVERGAPEGSAEPVEPVAGAASAARGGVGGVGYGTGSAESGVLDWLIGPPWPEP